MRIAFMASAMAGNVVGLRPKDAERLARWRRRLRGEKPIDIEITVLADDDKWREQRAWRFLFGLFQDCSCIQWSGGFKKTPGKAFKGRMRPSRVPLFLREAQAYVEDERASIRIDGKRLPARLLNVIAA